MPDISMCQNEKCRVKYDCYRYMAKPDAWQSYSSFGTEAMEECEYFWEYKFEIEIEKS